MCIRATWLITCFKLVSLFLCLHGKHERTSKPIINIPALLLVWLPLFNVSWISRCSAIRDHPYTLIRILFPEVFNTNVVLLFNLFFEPVKHMSFLILPLFLNTYKKFNHSAGEPYFSVHNLSLLRCVLCRHSNWLLTGLSLSVLSCCYFLFISLFQFLFISFFLALGD